MADKCPIAITGLSGRFPSADDLEQFKNNLFNGVDMVTSDDIRWPQGLWGLPARNGKVASMDKFDSEFFGVPEDQVRAMDPQERLLYELSYECLLDAGLRPEALGQTNTGCYHGSCMRAPNAELLDPEKVSGHVNRMVTRVSRYLKIRGPVFQADSACASGLTAFNQAYHAVRAGVCDQALVLAYNNILRPRISVNFMRMKMNSQDGRCKCLDKSANGYVRAEALVVLLLQKVDQAHRVHSVVLNSGSNCDGYTEEGVTFPSVSGQRALIRDTYNQINLDPVRIKYIEAHMTGTQAGDYVESKAIHDYFFNGGHRTEPLLMGCLKSSIGHSEGASGLCSLAKALIVHKERKIPPNLNYETANPRIDGLVNGDLVPVLSTVELDSDLIPVNCFGFGGSNVHVVTQRFDQNIPNIVLPQPRLVLICGRTEKSIQHLFLSIANDDKYKGPNFLYLVDQMSRLTQGSGMKRRGYFILNQNGGRSIELSHSEGQEMKKVLIEPLGHQVASSALEGLQVFEPFKKYIDQCRNDGALNGRPLNDRAMSCLVNIGILELFKCLRVDSDSLAGSSTGWLAVLCFEGSMTRDQAIGCCHVLDKHHHHYDVMAKFEKILNGSKGHWSARMSISELVHRVLSEKTYSNSIRLFGEKSSDSVVELLNAIGQLYISGHQVSIENLYPKVTRPLPSSTPFLSPLIKWNHEKTWPLTEFTGDASNNFYWRTVQNIEYNFDFNKPADEFLYDHTIDGRILFPGMGLLYYVWVTFCELQRSSILTTDITFRNVSFKRPIVMSKENKTRFTVRINEATGAFDVIHGDTSVSAGQIFNGTSGQVDADMDKRVNQDGCLLLDGAAIYKELKVRGYHYGRHFRGLLQADHRGHWGQAVWRPIVTPTVFESTKFANKAEEDQLMMSSWIPFVDSVCHLVLLDEKNDHRNLIIPTFVSSMEIDPVQLRRVLEDGPRVAGHGTESSGVVVTAHSDRETRQVTCSGLRVSGVKAGVVNRRRQPVTLYKYQFVPFNQQCPLDSSNSQMVRQYFEHVLEAGRGKPTSYRLSSGRDGLLRKLIKCDEAIDLSNDLLVGENGPLELFMELGLKTQLDMIVSNFVPTVKTIKVNEVNGTKWPLEPKVRQYLSGHFLGDLFDIQYHLYLSKNDSSWNGVSLTEQLNLADIVLFRPSSLTDKATTIKAVESIKEDGFLIVITRDVQIDARLQRATVMAAGEAIPLTRFDDSICPQFELEQISEKFCDSNLLPFKIRTYRKVNKSRHLYLSSRTVQIRAQGVFEPWLRELQECLESPQVDRIWISLEHEPNRGDSATINGLIGLVKSLRLEEGGHKVRCILNTVQNGGDTERVKVLDLVYNVQIDGRGWGSYEHFELPDIDGRNSAHFVQSSEFYLRCLKPGDLSSLTWTQLNSSPVRTGNRQIDIHYSALNFRDVMFASGRLSYEAIPYVDPQVLRDSFLGFEFSGHDQASGQRLMGLTDYKALASAIFLGHRQQDFLWPVPDQWSLEEAATVPSVYTTAYYALVVRGKLVDGESVLIHSAAGGVGLAALYVCLNRKCTVYATVGSEEKKQYLLRTFPGLKADHVLDSHSLQFEHDVLSQTNGLGVDIVLNSLAGPMLKASLRCLAQNGRFLEIGKVDFARNSKLELFELQGNQTYEGILLDALTTEDDPSGKVRKVRQTLARLLAEGIATGEVVPLTRTMFDRDQVESAFRFMGSGKHVGKVVIRIRPDGQQVSTPLCQPSLPRLTFDQNKVYIITGGLGGFGLELVQWMTTRLARRFVLTSRNGVKSDYQRYTVAKLRSQGNEIVISSLDASTMASARLLMVSGLSLGPVGGIFVLSVVLKDGLFENQTNDTFRAVIDSKACPAIHLDKLSRELCPEMAHFVAFSSLSCGRGNQGQVNYNYANNLVENVCERRHRDGLPGLAIQWGVMADVGWIEDKLAADPAFRSQLIGPSMVRFDRQQIASCLEVMEQLVHSNQPIATSCSWSPRSAGSAGPLPSGSGQDVVKLIASLIGVKEWQTLPGETTLAKLGIDSLINVEIKQVIERTTGSSMTLKQVRNLTIQGLMELNQGKKVLDLNHNHL